MTLIVGGLEVQFDPGQSYEHTDGTEESRAEQRQRAVKQFQDAASKTTRGHLFEAVARVIALTIQLRAVGGSGSGTGLGNQLREAADFLEDL